jgi:hypothetical protein
MDQPTALYVVLILKRTGDHVQVLETDNFDKAHSLWKELLEKWETCHKETKAFVLETPIVTAFEPGQITEITVMPVTKQKSDSNNPYVKDMLNKGFSKTFNNFARGEMLDEGYTR